MNDVGWAPIGMAAAALALLVLAGFSPGSRRGTKPHTDVLTGLGNRRKLLSDLEVACERAATGERFALVLYDLNGFKSYNDTFGHLPGDALLHGLPPSSPRRPSTGAPRTGSGATSSACSPLRGGEDAAGVSAMGSRALAESGEGFAISASPRLRHHRRRRSRAVRVARDGRPAYVRQQEQRASVAGPADDGRARPRAARALGSPRPARLEVAQLAATVGRRIGLSEQALRVLEQAAKSCTTSGRWPSRMPCSTSLGHSPTRSGASCASTVVGERMLSAAPALREVATIVRASHERFDGEGYPDRLGETPSRSRPWSSTSPAFTR